jgi:hypothetical protein
MYRKELKEIYTNIKWVILIKLGVIFNVSFYILFLLQSACIIFNESKASKKLIFLNTGTVQRYCEFACR